MAVKATNDFESDMARRFGGSSADSAADEVRPCAAAHMTHVTAMCDAFACVTAVIEHSCDWGHFWRSQKPSALLVVLAMLK